jgi:hypothetical protein
MEIHETKKTLVVVDPPSHDPPEVFPRLSDSVAQKENQSFNKTSSSEKIRAEIEETDTLLLTNQEVLAVCLSST